MQPELQPPLPSMPCRYRQGHRSLAGCRRLSTCPLAVPHKCLSVCRAGEGASTGLTEALVAKGFETARLKTGTPARVDSRSCDFSGLQEQPGDATVRWFSFDPQVCLACSRGLAVLLHAHS